MAPSRSFGSPQKMPWQRMVANLPNNAFDWGGPMRTYTNGTRAASFVAKIGELAAVGALSGAAMSVLGGAAVALRRRTDSSFQPSVAPPTLAAGTGGLALFMGISRNVRYQLIAGLDRYLFDHSNFLWSYLALSGVLRCLSHAVSSDSRLYTMGLPRGEPVRAATQWQQQQQPQPRQRAQPVAAAGGKQPLAGGGKPKTKRRVKKAYRGFAMSASGASA